MTDDSHGRARRSFTLIELVTVIVILGILSTVAVPMYLDYTLDARRAACKGSLGAMRSAIANFRAYSVTESGGGVLRYPTLGELIMRDYVVKDIIPDNPFDADKIRNNVEDAQGKPKGSIMGSDGGWAYDSDTGNIWANTGTKSVGENSF